MNNFKFAVLAMAGSVGLALAGTAGAQANDAPKLVLHYDAASLQTDAGVRHLYTRLSTAAEKVCPQGSSLRFPTAAVVECRRQAMAGAVEQIHNTRLAALSGLSMKTG